METYGGVEIQFHAFLTSVLDGGESHGIITVTEHLHTLQGMVL